MLSCELALERSRTVNLLGLSVKLAVAMQSSAEHWRMIEMAAEFCAVSGRLNRGPFARRIWFTDNRSVRQLFQASATQTLG